MKRQAEQPIDDLESQVKSTIAEPQKQELNEPTPDDKPLTNHKTRVAMIVGYNGIDFCGSQKNKDVRTVEEEIEKALFKARLIAKHNFGDLNKIAWNRATRTDKRVHALQNCFSCKIQYNDHGKEYHETYELLRIQLNDLLPSDVRIFTLIPVAARFDSKLNTSHREYSYFLPTYMLAPINDLCFESPPKPAVDPTVTKCEDDAEVVTQVAGGIKKILRKSNADDEVEDVDKFLDRDMSHITPEFLQKIQGYRMTKEQKQALQECWQSFIGTKKYHNYTKEIKAHQMTSQRFMMAMEASEFRYVNKKTFKVTTEDDPDGLEFVRFYLKGQSFLYNQIRKMVGVMIQVFHGKLGRSYIDNTHKDNVLQVALAPGDGLLCEKVAYDKYNEMTTTKEPIMVKLKVQKLEIDEYRDGLLQYICEREIKLRAFMCYMTWLDDNRTDYYIEYYRPKDPALQTAPVAEQEEHKE